MLKFLRAGRVGDRKARRRPTPLAIQRLEPRFALAAVDMILVPVGHPGNAADRSTGYGRVNAAFQIGKYEVTLGEYAAFLNAIAADDPHAAYDPALGADSTSAGIARSGSPGSYTYAVIGPNGITPEGADDPANRPVTYVTWFDAARFANWMANGQPAGGQSAATTENGAYDLTTSQAVAGIPPARNATNPNSGASPTFFLPSENEWYKAAYYSPDKGGPGVAGYWIYATQSDAPPANLPPGSATGANANYLVGPIYCVTQSNVLEPGRNYLTAVDAFATSASYYGTLNQNGSVYQWNDLAGTKSLSRGLRGGFWAGGSVTLRKSTFTQVTAIREANDAGFRLVGPAEN